MSKAKIEALKEIIGFLNGEFSDSVKKRLGGKEKKEETETPKSQTYLSSLRKKLMQE